MRAKSASRGDGPEAGVRLSAPRRRDRFAASRGNGPRLRGWYAGRYQSAIPAAHAIDPRLVLPGRRGARTAATDRHGISSSLRVIKPSIIDHRCIIIIMQLTSLWAVGRGERLT